MRHKVDWDKEIEKSEKIRKRGILMSTVSFAVACAFIFGATRFSGASLEIPKSILFAAVFCASAVIFRMIVKKRNSKRGDQK